MEKRKLKQIEEFIFALFQRRRAMKLLAREIFESSHEEAEVACQVYRRGR
jgi:hypothetical protein